MRLPKLRDLTQAQQDVYLYAPKDAHVLVEGPPGTGKTLIACLRAAELQKRGVPVVLGMFNRVLMKYASSAGDGEAASFPVQTARQWFLDWWNAAVLPPHPRGSELWVQVPFHEKDAAHDAGARWRPKVWRPWQPGRTGVWAVSYEEWAAQPSRFSAWRLWQDPPSHPASADEIDWDAVRDHVIDHEESLGEEALSLGTLLIDEGQDFAPGFYRFLHLLSAIGGSRRLQFPLKCFVLADENQQLTEFNSTLADIQSALKIAQDNRFRLLDNFRNTREIAELARSFFADVGVLPRLPDRRGELPAFSVCAGLPECIRRIMTWVVNHPGKETGVLVFRESKREALHELLKSVAGKLRGRDITVQSYSWQTRADNPVDELVFDRPDVITVLNMQSCKGLEFDAVFIVDLHDSPIGSLGADRFRMQMFVAVSRAREWVQLLASEEVQADAPVMKELPPEQYLTRGVRSPSTDVSSATTTRKESADEAPSGEDWGMWAKAFAQEHGCASEDLRPKGCFWLYAPESFSAELEKHGFRYSGRRKGWWRI